MNENILTLHRPVSRPIRLTIVVILLALMAIIGYIAGKGEGEIDSTTSGSSTTMCVAGAECNDMIVNPKGGSNMGVPTPKQSVPEAKKESGVIGWKTQIDSKNNFTFQYPSTWQVRKAFDGKYGEFDQVVYEIVDDNGEKYSLSNPPPETGYEAWNVTNESLISSLDPGIVFTRSYGPSTKESGLNNFLYNAHFNKDGEFQRSVSLIGMTKTLPVNVIGSLDKILSTFKFTK